ncbi:hypothetical protein [Bacillus sp. FJAT-45037]|uniref:hypothetical protein n=1 Tax=Bacillus sp. FJAT-45037 TaxID=2011007 RepID=UPI000C24F8AF|nr:hypothetical protein [Bacillus sp. FJAT-45037]
MDKSSNSILTFSDAEILKRYELFVSQFLMSEEKVNRKEILPRYWTVTVLEKDFNVTIELKNIGDWHGVAQWCAVVTEPTGDQSNYLLFKREIEEWAAEQRTLRGLE